MIKNHRASNQFLPAKIFLVLTTLLIIWAGFFATSTIGRISLPHLQVAFINIDHGDSILLISSKGDTVLIDAGYPQSGTLKYLKSHNITELDTVIATHAHEDHIGGIPEVLKNINVGGLLKTDRKSILPILKNYKKPFMKLVFTEEWLRQGIVFLSVNGH